MLENRHRFYWKMILIYLNLKTSILQGFIGHMLEKEWDGVELVKKGKLFVSHRYNLIPLLHSCPGGVLREPVVQDLPLARKINII